MKVKERILFRNLLNEVIEVSLMLVDGVLWEFLFFIKLLSLSNEALLERVESLPEDQIS